MKPARIRTADPDRDAAACVEIYAPYVEAGATSFEEEPPSPAEFAERIAAALATYPWLVAERGGGVVGYAYACPHRSRPAYRWAVEVSVYVAEGQRRGGCGRALYGELVERLRSQGFHIACAGITLPNEASVSLHESMGRRLVAARVGAARRRASGRAAAARGPAPATIGRCLRTRPKR